MTSNTEHSTVGLDESLLDDAAAAARTLSGFGKEIIGGSAVASRYFVENPIERQLSIFVANLTGRYCVLRAANRSGSQGEDLDGHANTDQRSVESLESPASS